MKLFDPAMSGLKNALGAIAALIPAGAKVAYVDYPIHQNIGDLLIMLGTQAFLRDYDLNVVYQASAANLPRWKRFDKDTVIVCHGGGNFGDLYPSFERFRERLVRSHPDNRIILLPQTIHFSSPQAREQAMRNLRAHRDLHVFTRDETSYAMAREAFGERAYLAPDMAHQLWPALLPADQGAHLSGTLYLMRTDKERAAADTPHPVHSEMDWFDLFSALDIAYIKFIVWAHRANGLVGNPLPLDRWWMREVGRFCDRARRLYEGHERIVTSRLHGHILACLMGKKSDLVDNSYGKNSAYFTAWTHRVPVASLVHPSVPEQPSAQAEAMEGRMTLGHA